MNLTIISSTHLRLFLLHQRGLVSCTYVGGQRFLSASKNEKVTQTKSHINRRNLVAITALSIGAYGVYKTYNDKFVLADSLRPLKTEETRAEQTKSNDDDDDLSSFGAVRANLKFYTQEEISKHTHKEDGIWVIYKSGVYDITKFIEGHPGGELILLAAGRSIEPFWNIYQLHRNKNILEMLEELRIGNFDQKSSSQSSQSELDDPWIYEPKRSPRLTVRSQKPFNAESPIDALVESPVTPNDIFFVRNHLPVPLVDPRSYKLTIKGIGVKESVSLSLDQLKERFPKSSVTMTIQCAGNRRSEMNQVKPVQGLAWSKGAISTATWTGVKLTDLLQQLQVNKDDSRIKHVHFIGLDKDPIKGSHYGASVPSRRILDPSSDVLIAYEMNGEEIPRDHGFPVRVVIPGIVGARQVKWLSEIILSSEENDSHWQHSDYKGFNASTDASNADYNKSVAIQDYPVQSAICVPQDNSVVPIEADGKLRVSGYAWSGGGRGIIRVDVSSDEGATWHEATLINPSDLYQQWAWTQWTVKVPVNKPGQVKIICKATDSSYCSQPEKFDGIWNFRGVLSNAWNTITVNCSR